MVLSSNICMNNKYSSIVETMDFLAFLQNEPKA